MALPISNELLRILAEHQINKGNSASYYFHWLKGMGFSVGSQRAYREWKAVGGFVKSYNEGLTYWIRMVDGKR